MWLATNSNMMLSGQEMLNFNKQNLG